MNNTIMPPRLNKGDTIGIFSPSQSIMVEPEHLKGFENGIERLRKLGFKTKIGKHAKGKYFYSSGTPEERVSDFHELLADKEVKAILMTVGGDTANEMLPLMDFDLIKNNPKIIMGMSDGTTILAPITDRTGLVTFYGPDLVYSFGIQKETEDFDEQILNCITGVKTEFKQLNNLTDDSGNKIDSSWQTIRNGVTEGQLVGGYLEIMVELVGSGWLKDLDNKILYLESMEGANTIHSRLQALKLMGVYGRVSGIILGYFPDVKKESPYYRAIGDIVLEITKELDFPILQVNELGHMVKNYVWPNGLKVKLDATNKMITSLETPVV